jgi:replicative DNA helicase
VDWEKQLVSRVARDQSIDKLLAAGIKDTHFSTNGDGKPGHAAQVYGTMLEHVRVWNAPPSFDVVVQANPDYEFDDPRDTLEYITNRFLNGVKRREAVRVLKGIALQMDGPGSDNYLEQIDGHILAAARDLSTVLPKNASQKFSDMPRRIEKYEAIKQWGQPMGIPYPFPDLNALTMGIQPHEFITISGWSGLGKSYLGLLMCFHAYLAGKTPMIISLEMGAEAINRRLDIMATNLSHTAMKSIQLGEGNMEHWKEIAEKVNTCRKDHDIIILDDLGKCDVDKVYAETVRYNPDLVMLDYISLMQSHSGFRGAHWEKITEITRNLKGQARGLGIPILAIAQTNRESAKEGARDSNIAYANAILQDSDVVFGLHASEEMKANKQMELRLLKNREGIVREWKLYWDVENGMIRDWSPGDIFANARTENQL